MQAITRNPLADPGLLGVNSGASLAVVIAIWVLHITTMNVLVWVALLGAGIVSVVVYALGSLGRGGATPVRLALAGAAINALLGSLISAVLLISQETLDTYRFWVVGSLSGTERVSFAVMLPFIGSGLLLALLAAPSLNAVALGDDTAKALGTRLGLTRVASMMAITLLCGTAVAAAGPIGFLGLVVPHVARFWCGADQRWVIAYSALLGPIVLVLSDVAGRIILPPGEVQVGIMTALIGGPLFVLIVRRMRMAQL
jgi:iron complex transport system permease protein